LNNSVESVVKPMRGEGYGTLRRTRMIGRRIGYR